MILFSYIDSWVQPTVIVILLVIAFIFFAIGLNEYEEKYTAIGIVIGFLLFIGFMFALVNDNQKVIEVKTKELYTINDSTSVSGNFFLGSGSVDEKGVYWYYYEINGGYQRDYVESNGTIIYTNDEEIPRIEFQKTQSSWFIFRTRHNKVVIYVPEGSITNSYDFDNK